MSVSSAGALLVAALTLAAPVDAMQDSRAPTPVAVAGDTATHHTVVGGDTLWSLAEAFYGDPDLWVALFEANRASVAGPDRLRPGQILEIPPVALVAGAAPVSSAPGTPEPTARTGPSRARASTDPAARQSTARLATIAVGQGGSAAVVDASAPVPVRRSAPASPPSGPTAQGSDEHSAPTGAGIREAAPIPAAVFGGAPLLIDREAATLLVDSVGSSPRLPRPGDRVGVELDALTAETGLRVQSVRLERVPDGGGVVAVPTAVLRLESGSGGSPMAKVEAVFGRVAAGDRLLPFPAPTHVASSSTAVSSGPEVVVLATATDRPILRLGDWVFLDVGEVADVEVGDEFVPAWVADAERRPGRLQVVRLEGPHATARIVRLGGSAFEPGRRVRLDRRRR